ncbi:MAG: DNA-deoxyinosine glycosylase [Pseudomonadota bacterium]
MSYVCSFEPVSAPSARVLILGSIPGDASLKAKQYYAHWQNSFWKIMSEITNVSHTATYEQRVASLIASKIALWDVLESCTRPGSMDASIVRNSIKVNDFPRFFSEHRSIHIICFNGATAEAEYMKHVMPLNLHVNARLIRLPSTSPAYAAMPFKDKLTAWRTAVCT